MRKIRQSPLPFPGRYFRLECNGDSHVTVLKNETEDNSNIVSNGYTIYYDAANEDNAWLNGETITLSDGGTIQPEE